MNINTINADGNLRNAKHKKISTLIFKFTKIIIFENQGHEALILRSIKDVIETYTKNKLQNHDHETGCRKEHERCNLR